MSKNRKQKMITPEIMRQAVVGAFTKLDPRYMMKNPVMFVVEIGFVISLVLSFVPGLLGDTTPNARVYNSIVSAILFVTVLFANFAESVAEGRGKAQAASLKKTKKDTQARLLGADGGERMVPSSELKKGDVVMVSALCRADEPARRHAGGEIHTGSGPPSGGGLRGAAGRALHCVYRSDTHERCGPARRPERTQGGVRRH